MRDGRPAAPEVDVNAAKPLSGSWRSDRLPQLIFQFGGHPTGGDLIKEALGVAVEIAQPFGLQAVGDHVKAPVAFSASIPRVRI
jgi:hypothetical protein